jgi:hypothetical protein
MGISLLLKLVIAAWQTFAALTLKKKRPTCQSEAVQMSWTLDPVMSPGLA